MFLSTAPLDLTPVSDIAVQALVTAAGSALVILTGLYGLRICIEAFKEGADIKPMTSDEMETMMHNDGIYGPFGPDVSDEGDERNYTSGFNARGEQIGPVD